MEVLIKTICWSENFPLHHLRVLAFVSFDCQGAFDGFHHLKYSKPHGDQILNVFLDKYLVACIDALLQILLTAATKFVLASCYCLLLLLLTSSQDSLTFEQFPCEVLFQDSKA